MDQRGRVAVKVGGILVENIGTLVIIVFGSMTMENPQWKIHLSVNRNCNIRKHLYLHSVFRTGVDLSKYWGKTQIGGNVVGSKH